MRNVIAWIGPGASMRDRFVSDRVSQEQHLPSRVGSRAHFAERRAAGDLLRIGRQELALRADRLCQSSVQGGSGYSSSSATLTGGQRRDRGTPLPEWPPAAYPARIAAAKMTAGRACSTLRPGHRFERSVVLKAARTPPTLPRDGSGSPEHCAPQAPRNIMHSAQIRSDEFVESPDPILASVSGTLLSRVPLLLRMTGRTRPSTAGHE